MFVNDEHSTVTRLFGQLSLRMTIIQLDMSLIYSLLTAKCIDLSVLIDYSTYFKDVIQYYNSIPFNLVSA